MSAIIFDKFNISSERVNEFIFQTKGKVIPLKIFPNGDVIFGKSFKLILDEKSSFGEVLVFDFEEDLNKNNNSCFNCFYNFFRFLRLINHKNYRRVLIVDTWKKVGSFSMKDREDYYSIMEFKY
jgi:hypothetical protein